MSRWLLLAGPALIIPCLGVEEQECIACGSLNKNWQEERCKRFVELGSSSNTFVGRHGHATAIFPTTSGELALWVIGGRGTEYTKWNFERTTQFADVHYTVDGSTWTQVAELHGDFEARTDVGFLMEDVVDPGDIAPFWERYGHSVNVVRVANGSSISVNMMVLCGGFTPRPDNDVWISEDGEGWYRVGYAPWAGRGYHATAIFHDRLLIMGGSPLTNDIWAGTFNKTGPRSYTMHWQELGNATGIFYDEHGASFEDARNAEAQWTLEAAELSRWSPRAGAAATVQFMHSTNVSGPVERIFLTGGFSAWPCDDPAVRCHPLYDGARCRNDVWVSTDGDKWTRLVAAAPWAARAWHSFVTWSDLVDPYRDVALAAGGFAPRLWLAGGAYIGNRDNNVVRALDAYADLWWTRDGRTWTRVSAATGAGRHLCSSIEAYQLAANDAFVGKYGHSLVPFWRTLNDALVCEDTTLIHGTRCASESNLKTTPLIVPALFFVAGDAGAAVTPAAADVQPSSNVYASASALLCDINGHKCPYPQVLRAPFEDNPPTYERRLSDDILASRSTSKTRAGVCPDPLHACEDALYCKQNELTFYVALNNSASLEVPSNVPWNSYQFAYTAYNISTLSPHPHSLAGIYTDAHGHSLLHGYVARLSGCQCANKQERGSIVGEFSGEYCEVFTQLDAAPARPRPAYFAPLVLASILSLHFTSVVYPRAPSL